MGMDEHTFPNGGGIDDRAASGHARHRRRVLDVLVDDGVAVEPAEKYLAYLAALERSPNTVRAYALSLKFWFEFLAAVDVDWAAVGVEDVARFVAWLRAPAANVIVLDGGTARRSRRR